MKKIKEVTILVLLFIFKWHLRTIYFFIKLFTIQKKQVFFLSRQFDSVPLNYELLINLLAIPFINHSDKYINPNNGGLAVNVAYTASDYIAVIPSKEYNFYGFTGHNLYGAWYDEDKNYISGIIFERWTPYVLTYTSPNNAFYLRVSTQSTYFSDAKVFLTDSVKPELNPDIKITIPDSFSQRIKEYVNNQISKIVPSIVDGVVVLGQLEETLADTYINPVNGLEVSLSAYTATDFLGCAPSSSEGIRISS